MIDIIIPAYNAHDTIIQTLSSVAIQTIRDKANIYIVDDCSLKNYDEEINMFKGMLNIKQLRTEKNRGAGYAREFGINNSSSDYILFLDADDLLYDCFSLDKLYKIMNASNYNLVAGLFVNEGKDDASTFVVDENGIFGCLHGKLYRRKYLIDNNIRFNYTRYSEDNSFNGIVVNTTSKYKVISDIVYVYRYNPNSITNEDEKLVRIHSSYLHNMLWLIKQLEKRGVDVDTILCILLNSYVYIYHEVVTHVNVDFKKMYYQCFMFEEYYKKYEDKIDLKHVYAFISKHFNGDIEYLTNMINGFTLFRNNFKKLGDMND